MNFASFNSLQNSLMNGNNFSSSYSSFNQRGNVNGLSGLDGLSNNQVNGNTKIFVTGLKKGENLENRLNSFTNQLLNS